LFPQHALEVVPGRALLVRFPVDLDEHRPTVCDVTGAVSRTVGAYVDTLVGEVIRGGEVARFRHVALNEFTSTPLVRHAQAQQCHPGPRPRVAVEPTAA